MMNKLFLRQPFSILNKIRNHQKLRNGVLNRPVTQSHVLGDFVGSASYEQEKNNLTPHQKFLIETRAMERPFTGMFWAQNQTGFYHCVVCNTRLFSFDTKFESKTGFATFWKGVENRVRIVEEEENPGVSFDHVNYARNKADLQQHNYRRCQCAQCQSHIGVVYFDGPPPTFLRFSVNSSLLRFEPLKPFEDPNIKRRQKKLKKLQNKVEYIK